MEMLSQIPKRRELVDCFNCSTSRRPCDRTRHRCDTCTKTSEICQGYPRELQWLTGVTSRGKQKGHSLSIGTSNREWESMTPTNHNFIFKQGKPQKMGRQGTKRAKARAAHKTGHQQSQLSTSSSKQQPHYSSTVGDEPSSGSNGEASQNYGLTTADICDPDPSEGVDPIFDDLDSSLNQTFCNNDIEVFLLPLQSPSVWPNDDNVHFSLTHDTLALCASPPFAPPSLGTSELLTFYDTELCTLPLTFDFQANPFRCTRGHAQGPLYLVHTLLAFSMQHISRMNDTAQDDVVRQQITAYKNSAADLCSIALRAAPEPSKKLMLDTILMLFALETLISSSGPWNARLLDAYQKIESIGGMNALASSPRSRARLAMFVWYDCSIALLSRSESVFPSSYYDFVLSCDDDPSWDIFTLSGVPKDLFKYFRELIQLASEKEQISKMKYASFDTRRVLELERYIQEYSVEEFSPQSMSGSDEMIQSWHDYCNSSNGWKYALLLYISRVLKWDRISDARLPEIPSLSRLLLDSVRSCRPVSSLRKQLLFPIFLAGSELSDAYSRDFVKEYCEEWYQTSRYAMFMETLALLQEIWAQKDLKNNDFRVWWGSLVGSKQPNGSEFLFG